MKAKNSLLLLIVIFLFPNAFLFSQNSDLYIPREINRAYQKGSRSFDGKPGENYFQNRTDYVIDATFDPYTRLLTGSETITFTNNSPDTLIRLVVRLNPNILKRGAERKVSIDSDDANDGMEITRLVVEGEVFDMENKPPYIDKNNMYIRLPKHIPPGAKADVEIDWKYIFQANSNIREGRYQETTFFIAYWYPKIAVYDDLEGWNRHVYNGEQEFYHEYGDFDVNISVPADFYVWSSGLLQNAKSVLNADKYALFEKSKTSDEVINVLQVDDVTRGDLPRQTQIKTWHFKADYLPDFAFCLSDTFLWDATSVEVGGERVHIHAVYYRGSADFDEVAELSRETIRLLSDQVFGIDFPYPQMTAFNGHFGMEFPMMVNDGDGENRNSTIFVTAHEIGHTYFPFLVGTNEEKYAWMDEGLITFLPKEIEDSLTHDAGRQAFANNISTYSRYAGSKYDAPLMVPSDQLTGVTYMYVSYSRAGVAFYVLQDILGQDLFKKAMKEFIERWEGKHPTPYDFFFTFEDVTSQDLTWFWEPWFFEFGYPDLAISNAVYKKGELTVEVDKVGSFPTPVHLLVTYEDGSQEEIGENTDVWKIGDMRKSIILKSDKKVKKVEIDRSKVPDNNPENDIFELK